MKVTFKTRFRKAYNRIANHCPIDNYSYESKKPSGLRQQYKQMRNRLVGTSAVAGFAGAEMLRYASVGAPKEAVTMGLMTLGMGYIARVFHRDMIRLQNSKIFKEISERAVKIFGKN